MRWATLVVLCLSSLAHADFFSSSPGALSRAHAQIGDCAACHDQPRQASPQKCLACHQPIAIRQRLHQGLHGGPKALGKPCALCHSEHHGRAADLLGFVAFGGLPRFDHAVTGFGLDGKHAAVRCAACHTQRSATGAVSYLGAATDCARCHANPHGETQPTFRRCERCHDAKSWAAIARPEFDHAATRYPIEKKHLGLACAACHARSTPGGAATRTGALPRLVFRWTGWAVDCQPCHQNTHGTSLFGQKACRLCHSAKVEFSQTSFEHRRTHFALDGAHGKVACSTCHADTERKKPERSCNSCHVDVHQKRFAAVGDCSACHTSTRFADIRFDHAARTRFALTGAHRKGTCRSCHRGTKPGDFESLTGLITKSGKTTTVACLGCHKHENAHQRQYGDQRCLACHKLAGVVEQKRGAVAEQHGPDSAFPLTEGHAGVDCARCHPGGVFAKTSIQCGPACHADQLHKGTLGNDCRRCHEGGSFAARGFDHRDDTEWPLVGNHRDVACESCHPRRDFAGNRGLGSRCVSCHAKDDVHAGALGTNCQTCHEPTGKTSFDHGDPMKSDWPLTGAHQKVRCADCHPSVRFKPVRRDCAGCHPEPEVHRGQLGTQCASCHVEQTWTQIQTKHDAMRPPLSGAHDRVPCARCHTGGRTLAGTGELCVSCHQKDDTHHGSLGPRCGECHSQHTFAGARFQHARVGCDLVGVHRILPCVDCHVGGNQAALAPTCASCHRKDALRGATAYAAQGGSPSAHAGFQTCANCHNGNYFGPRAEAGLRESVCR